MITKLMKFSPMGLLMVSGVLSTAQAADTPSLVPTEPAPYSPHYWCTWYVQNYWQQRGGEITDFNRLTNLGAQEEMNHHHIFNEKDGWAHYMKRGREDLTFLIDHGWQPIEGNWDKLPGSPYFNFRADPKDFPPYAGLEPQEQMKTFNKELQDLGWRGLGIWVRGQVSLADMETFTKWSKHAGVTYWKIDGGDTGQYLAMQAKNKHYPELIMEHAHAPGHFNANTNVPDAEEYPSTFAAGESNAERTLRNLKNTDVIRVYDVAPHLITPTTVQRINDILLQTNGDSAYTAIINTQDLPYVSMALGTSIASKRHPNYMERTWKGRDLHHQLEDDRMMQFSMNEVERLGRWSRIAMPIPVGVGSYLRSENYLVDHYTHDAYSTWNRSTYGKKLYQGAPAVMARNMPLPEVAADKEGNVPYVMASTYPDGATAIATEPRVTDKRKVWFPRAAVAVKIHDASKVIGIAGHYGSLTLEFAGPLDGVTHVWAQDLLDVKSEDIKDKLTISGNKLTIPGTLIDRIGTAAKDEKDVSAPGMVIRLEGTDLPVAGDEYFPKAKRITEPTRIGRITESKKVVQSASLNEYKDSYGDQAGYRIKAVNGQQIALKALDKPITTGKAIISWKMKAVSNPTKNGFLVLSNDAKGGASVLAGSWIGSNNITIFENTSDTWSGSDKDCETKGELDCKAILDMDERSVTLTINGVTHKEKFSETVPNVGYIGFATQRAETLFSEPKVKQ